MPTKRINVDIDNLINLRNSGMSLSKISENVGVSVKVVRSRLIDAGIDTSIPTIEYDVDKIVKLYKSGMDKRSVGKTLGIHEMIVSKILSKNGYPTSKTRSESQRIRMSRMTQEERQKISRKAHDSVRGTKKTDSDLRKRAISKGKIGKADSIMEQKLLDLLTDRGLSVSSQFAIDKYNIDILVCGTVAVEISGRRRKMKDFELMRRRTKKILDSGYILLNIWTNTVSFPITDSAAEYVISLINLASSDPSSIGKYWVIRGNGNVIAERCSYCDDIPFIMSPKCSISI